MKRLGVITVTVSGARGEDRDFVVKSVRTVAKSIHRNTNTIVKVEERDDSK